MKFNTKTRYGLRIMIYLAKTYKDQKGILQKEISKEECISFKYMDIIISNLKKTGLIVNAGGHKRGYMLSRPPSKITVYDIYKAFNDDLCLIPCIYNQKNCSKKKTCVARSYWMELNDSIIHNMKKISIKDISLKKTKLD